MALLRWKDYKLGKRSLDLPKTVDAIKVEEVVVAEAIKDTEELPETKNDFDAINRLNTATIEELCRVKGIGRKTAEKIVAAQEVKSVEEVRNMVSATVYARLCEWLDQFTNEKNTV